MVLAVWWGGWRCLHCLLQGDLGLHVVGGEGLDVGGYCRVEAVDVGLGMSVCAESVGRGWVCRYVPGGAFGGEAS